MYSTRVSTESDDQPSPAQHGAGITLPEFSNAESFGSRRSFVFTNVSDKVSDEFSLDSQLGQDIEKIAHRNVLDGVESETVSSGLL
jgi:hypothetical protein